MQRFFVLFFAIQVYFNDCIAQLNPTNYATQKEIHVNKAAVVSAHALASDAGINVLKQGGNAFDAAIATQLVLAVVYPNAGNLGGGGFMVAVTANGKKMALDYRETAPALATRDMYLDAQKNPIDNLSQQGHLAAGVPGTVAGIFEMYKYAKLPFAKLIKRAIFLAENGFALTASQAQSLNNNKTSFVEVNKFPIAFVKQENWRAGDLLVQKDLAKTLKAIKKYGAKGFYEGAVAKLIVAEMQKGNGLISLADLKNYKAKDRGVMAFNYKNTEVLTMPLPSSGGIILQQLLKICTFKNLDSLPFQSAKSVQLMLEAERVAFRDRAAYLGDPNFVKVPVDSIVSDAYLQNEMRNFTFETAGKSISNITNQTKESEQTTHISIVDEAGNAVAITTTLNDNYGSKTVVKGAGFILNNEMDDFSIKPGVPNMYGAIGNDKNAIAPGKTMLSSMTPTIVLKNGKPIIIVGTPGGTTIPTSVFQSIINLLVYNLSASDAVNKPKFHHQWLPDEVYFENNFPVNIIAELKAKGYQIKNRGQIGRTELITIDKTKKQPVTAIADSRGDDDARGF
jgi:gamma-glutamyltranspeptidase / glutathione hydrolase